MVRDNNDKIDNGIYSAKGHDACLMLFDANTVLVPLTQNEIRLIRFAVNKQSELLKKSKDFPEEKQYNNVLDNLITADFMLFSFNTKRLKGDK